MFSSQFRPICPTSNEGGTDGRVWQELGQGQVAGLQDQCQQMEWYSSYSSGGYWKNRSKRPVDPSWTSICFSKGKMSVSWFLKICFLKSPPCDSSLWVPLMTYWTHPEERHQVEQVRFCSWMISYKNVIQHLNMAVQLKRHFGFVPGCRK